MKTGDGGSENAKRSAMQIRAALAANPKNLVMGIAGAMTLAFGFVSLGAGTRATATVWAAVIIASLLWNLQLSLRFNRQLPADDETLEWGRRITRHAIVAAGAWGSASWLFLPTATVPGEACVLVTIAMVIMGGAGAQASYRPLVSSFVLVLTFAFCAGLLRIGDRFHTLFALIYALFAVAVLMFARDQEKTVRAAIDLSAEREALLQNLTIQHEATKRSQQEAEDARAIAERADRAKTRFLASATHDLRQPMHTIGLLVGLVRERALAPDVHAMFERIGELVERMERLFNALLDLSKFDAGAVQVNLGDIALSALLEEIELSEAPIAAAKGLRLRVHRSGVIVRSDPVLLNRILRNLVENAIRYTEKGRVVVGVRRGHTVARLQVLDSGPGISDKDRERIFEEFVRGDAGLQCADHGLGLGLSIVQRSAQLLVHRLSVRSQPGRGSCFEIQVPVGDTRSARDKVEDTRICDDEAAPLTGAFIALIEDDPESLDAMALQLRQWGCHVAAAASVSMLLKELTAHLRSPDAIISDYRLEGMPMGLRAVAELREALNESVPAMIVTGEAGAEDLVMLKESGLPIMFKPVTPAGLRRQLVALLESPTIRPCLQPNGDIELPRAAGTPPACP